MSAVAELRNLEQPVTCEYCGRETRWCCSECYSLLCPGCEEGYSCPICADRDRTLDVVEFMERRYYDGLAE